VGEKKNVLVVSLTMFIPIRAVVFQSFNSLQLLGKHRERRMIRYQVLFRVSNGGLWVHLSFGHRECNLLILNSGLILSDVTLACFSLHYWANLFLCTICRCHVFLHMPGKFVSNFLGKGLGTCIITNGRAKNSVCTYVHSFGMECINGFLYIDTYITHVNYGIYTL